MLDAALIHVGQHGVGAANGEEGRLGEELAHVVEVGVAAQRQEHCGADGDESEGGQGQLGQRQLRVRRRWRVVVDQRRAVALVAAAMAAATGKLRRQQLAADGAEDARRQHDPGKADVEEENADEGGG